MAVFSGNGSNTAPSFTFSSDTNTGMFRFDADELAFATAGTTAVRINSNQRVGIGANPLARLHAADPSSSSLQHLLRLQGGEYTGNFATGLRVSVPASGPLNPNRFWQIDADQRLTVERYVTSTDTVDTSGGVIEFNPTAGTVIIGAGAVAATGGPLQVGGGITFPATAVASSNVNTLDDYEEGTWTPAYDTTNSDLTGFAYGSAQGRYVKIGKLVTLSCTVSTFNAASISGTGRVIVTGLPFPSNDIPSGVAVHATTQDNRFSNNPFGGIIPGSANTTVHLYKTQAMNSANEMQVADFNATNTNNFNLLHFCITYTTI